MFSSSLRRNATFVLLAACVFILYFFGLTRTGMLGPDEPRYAAIGLEMAHSGDWVTPRLWGSPWFEKPALLYWMTAAAFESGLSEDLAPRLPVALLSVAFLAFFWDALRREYDIRTASYAAAILGTSAGWLAFSHIGVTDLPLSACAGASMLLVAGRRNPVAAGVLLGLAILAKGLVPLALFVPAIWLSRDRLRILALILGVAMAVAGPWYVLAIWRNGMPLIDELIVRHHFSRFMSGVELHPAPFWYYLPVLCAGLFPWTPLLVLLFRRGLYASRYACFLLAWLLWGLIFFSLSKGKLPGYLLPVLPPLAALLAVGLARAARPWILAAAAGLVGLVPAIAAILPDALMAGLSHTSLPGRYELLIPVLILGAGMAWMIRKTWRDQAVATVVALMALAVFRLVWQTYPVLDRAYSARAFWRAQMESGTTLGLCTDSEDRVWRYGLNYYAKKLVPDCNRSR